MIINFGLTVVESDANRGEVLEFVNFLRHVCDTKPLCKAWWFCEGINEWYVNWPLLTKLWQYTLDIPSSIEICERGFSKQNAIKSHVLNHLLATLKLDTLDALMRVSLCGLKLVIDWREVIDLWLKSS